MRRIWILSTIILSLPSQADELKSSVIGCVDGDSMYLLDKYRDRADAKAIEMMMSGGLCRSRNPASCIDEEAAFMMEAAGNRGDVGHMEKIIAGGLCEALPQGSQYSVLETGLFVSVIKMHSTGKIYHAHVDE